MVVSAERRVSWWWLVGSSAVAFVLLVVLVLVRFDPLVDFDSRVSRATRSATLAHPLGRAVMSAITATGSTRILGPLAALGCAVLLAFRRWREAVFVAVAMIATV